MLFNVYAAVFSTLVSSYVCLYNYDMYAGIRCLTLCI